MEDNHTNPFGSEKPQKSLLGDIRERLALAAKTGKKTSGSDSDSGADPGSDPDIDISPKTSAKPEEKKEPEDDAPRISIAEAMREMNEAFEKEITDAARLSQQKRVLREDEEKRDERVRLAEDILATPDDSDGQRTPAD